MQKKRFTQKIIDWYREHKRNLPWRETSDPYRIWLSEIILQQTRVAQGIPYYLKFVERFPEVNSLADASEQDVLRLWQGLGYYTRARNLHRCARVIRDEYGGKFPGSFNALLKLPGIGSYTAAAIASIAFGEPVAVVDGNVYRVLARVFGVDDDISVPATRNVFFSLASELISPEHPADFNQAMMEFGATWCTPRNPKCETCIFKNSCSAFRLGIQELLPVKSKKTKIRKRYFYYLVIRHNKKLALKKRELKDIWEGLYDFYAVETSRPQNPASIIAQSDFLSKLRGNVEVGGVSRTYRHILSHQIISARFISLNIKRGKSIPLFEGRKVRFYTASEVHDLPKPVLVSKHLEAIDYL